MSINFDRMLEGVSYRDCKFKIIKDASGIFLLVGTYCKETKVKRDLMKIGEFERAARKRWGVNSDVILNESVEALKNGA